MQNIQTNICQAISQEKERVHEPLATNRQGQKTKLGEIYLCDCYKGIYLLLCG